mmetsp:Transcript_6670/g.16176  ORF Transcript_6670/g.16176 Transcript_6670/m.16176 type:complete len:122 (-) Transcript_6670:198-563(-)
MAHTRTSTRWEPTQYWKLLTCRETSSRVGGRAVSNIKQFSFSSSFPSLCAHRFNMKQLISRENHTSDEAEESVLLSIQQGNLHENFKLGVKHFINLKSPPPRSFARGAEGQEKLWRDGGPF